jgi:hypothetical protein
MKNSARRSYSCYGDASEGSGKKFGEENNWVNDSMKNRARNGSDAEEGSDRSHLADGRDNRV